MIQGIPQANDFRRKIEFIRLVVKEWVTNGGLGVSDMEPEGRLRWGGYRELVNVKVPYKHVWVTVGGRNGDDRRVAWFDPKSQRLRSLILSDGCVSWFFMHVQISISWVLICEQHHFDDAMLNAVLSMAFWG